MKLQLSSYIREFDVLSGLISAERQELLKHVALEIFKRDNAAKLVFICTHNSRRSHMSQIWASTFADHFGLSGIETYSGGTEVTAMNIRVVNALLQAGFGVLDPKGENPKYEVIFDPSKPPIVCYSKVFDADENPKTNFLALMTCSDVDESCPIIPGADIRFPLYYDDPKEADDTPWEGDRYNERLKQIGIEIYYLMKTLANL